MNALPFGWASALISDVAQIVGGGTPPSKDEECFTPPGQGVPWITPADLSGYRHQTISRGARDLSKKGLASCSAKVMPTGTVLFSSRAPIGYVAIATNPIATNQGFKSFVLPKGIDSRFAYYQLKHIKPVAEALATGTTFKELSGSAAAKLPFSVAPSLEQQRIADKLDTVLTRVDAVNDRLARVAPLLKRFRQSILAAATSGRLTEDWRTGLGSQESGQSVVERDAVAKADLLRSNPALAKKKSTTHSKINENYLFQLPASWCFSTWGQISEWITYGFTRPMPSTVQGRRLLTAKDVHPFEVRLESSGHTSPDAFSELSEKDKPLVGDLLITKDGSIGRAALVRTTNAFCINQSVAVCWLRSTTMDRNYLEIVANADFTQRFVADMAKGMAIQHLSIVDFACCPVPVPPMSEQSEIVRRVETLFAFADRLEARLQAAQTATERLTPSLLAKAFRGELVPQDPNDEPASELLRRLQAQAPTSTPKRGRKRSA